MNGPIGSGHFATVEQGVWRNGARNIQIAVKLFKESASRSDRIKFLQEAAIMAQFKHPNIVSLLGVVCEEDSVS